MTKTNQGDFRRATQKFHTEHGTESGDLPDTEPTSIQTNKPSKYEGKFDVDKKLFEYAKIQAKEEIKSYSEGDDFKRQIKEVIEEKTKEIESKIDNSRIKTVETLGVFVALFTFISVEFQVYRVYTNICQVAGISLILLGSLLLFLLTMDLVLNNKISFYRYKENKTLSIFRSFQQFNEIKLSFHPKTWGIGIYFVLLSLLLIVVGVCLFIELPNKIKSPVSNSECEEIDYRRDKIDICLDVKKLKILVRVQAQILKLIT